MTCLIALASAAAGAWVSAQSLGQPVNPTVVLSGGDLGFRITATEGKAPVGTLVVKINDKWVDVKFRDEWWLK